MKITIAKVKALNPCGDRFYNFVKSNPGFNGTLAQFLSLDTINQRDKIWVVSRLITKNQAQQWSIACAESVKHIFENKFPKNMALSNLFNYMKSGIDFDNLSEEEKAKLIKLRDDVYAIYAAYYAVDAAYYAVKAAYYAVKAADDANYVVYAADAAYYAAKAAYYATVAADTAHYAVAYAVAYVAYAVAYAAYADAAGVDAHAAVDAYAAAYAEQQNLNLLFLTSLLN